mmetsp:Transcript_96483/g.171540  ORF Transcript_96483/g.171540 Transcript_96483/m.171540 type:complete len:186 (-) Transcript_96483:43-600(-)
MASLHRQHGVSKVLMCLFSVAAMQTLCSVWPSAFAGQVPSLKQQLRARSLTALCAVVAQVKEIPAEGDRVIVDGSNGPIIVANVGGNIYAVDAKCPHLGLPMKQGKIEDGPDGPALTCNFHNSQFNMKTGFCTRWVTGALGFENDFVAGIMGNVGSGKANVQSYKVVKAEDGSLSLVLPEDKVQE